MSKKYLYYFSEGNDAFGGDKVTMKNTLGGKGAGLAEMTAAGMPVPQGFTITTDACTQYYADGRQINDDITADIFEHLKGLEEITGKTRLLRVWPRRPATPASHTTATAVSCRCLQTLL